MSLCSLFRTAAKVSPLISTLSHTKNWSSSRYFQRPDTSAISYIQKHKYRSQCCCFFNRDWYTECVGVINTLNRTVWSRVTVYFNQRKVNDLFRRCVNVLSPFVSLSSVSASMSSRSTQDVSSWQQRRLSWWNYAKAPATHLRIARKHWRSLTMT